MLQLKNKIIENWIKITKERKNHCRKKKRCKKGKHWVGNGGLSNQKGREKQKFHLQNYKLA